MKKLVCIVGPTGVGKTALAIELAKKLNAELISADSRQVYVGMDIATGKEVADGEWQQHRGRKVLVINEIPIFGLDLVQPDQQFSVHDWMQAILPVIDNVITAGRTPLIVGGTGFYLSALQGKIDTLHAGYNQALRTELSQLSIDRLQGELQRINAARWKNLNDSDRNNPRRLIRAIEITQQQDKMKNAAQAYSLPPTPYTLHMIGLTMNRQDLYKKIDSRIEKMFNQGLIEETKELLKKYDRHLPSMTGIGYAEAVQYLGQEVSLEQAVQKVKWRNHSYVRRQYTWFRKQEIEWVDVGASGWQGRINEIIKDLST